MYIYVYNLVIFSIHAILAVLPPVPHGSFSTLTHHGTILSPLFPSIYLLPAIPFPQKLRTLATPISFCPAQIQVFFKN